MSYEYHFDIAYKGGESGATVPLETNGVCHSAQADLILAQTSLCKAADKCCSSTLDYRRDLICFLMAQC